MKNRCLFYFGVVVMLFTSSVYPSGAARRMASTVVRTAVQNKEQIIQAAKVYGASLYLAYSIFGTLTTIGACGYMIRINMDLQKEHAKLQNEFEQQQLQIQSIRNQLTVLQKLSLATCCTRPRVDSVVVADTTDAS